MSDDLDDEHTRLKAQVEQLQREHDELERRGGDAAAHRVHKERLRKKIAELHQHLKRLRAES